MCRPLVQKDASLWWFVPGGHHNIDNNITTLNCSSPEIELIRMKLFKQQHPSCIEDFFGSDAFRRMVILPTINFDVLQMRD